MNQQLIDLLSQFKDELKKDINTQRNLIVSELKDSLSLMSNKMDNLNREVCQLDRENRKRNLVLFGISKEFKDFFELERFVCEFLNEKLHLTLDSTHFDFVRRLGIFQENKVRPILIGLTQFRTKLTILKNSPMLKGSGIKLSEDLPREVLQHRKTLIPKLIEARKEGKYAVIKYDKLVIRDGNNSEYSMAQRQKRQLSATPPENLDENRKLKDTAMTKKTKSGTKPNQIKEKLQQFSYGPHGSSSPSVLSDQSNSETDSTVSTHKK